MFNRATPPLQACLILLLCLGWVRVGGAESVIIVSNTTDTVNGDISNFDALRSSPGSDAISLREALLAAENTAGPKRISFAPELKGCTIRFGADGFDNYRWPILKSGQLSIDGDIDGDNEPDVLLDGSLTTSPTGCFEMWSSSNTIAHLAISNFPGISVNICQNDPNLTNATILSNCILSNVIAPRDVSGSHAILVAGPASWPKSAKRQILNTTISGNRIIKGDIGIGNLFNRPELCISNTMITKNAFTDSDFAITVSGGIGMEENGSFLHGSNNVVTDTLVADNVIRGTTDSYDGGMAICVVGGMIGASPNLVENTRIQNNIIEHSTIGLVLSGGDCDSDYSGWTTPTVYISDNVVTNTLIAGNTFTNCWASIVCCGGDHHKNRILDTTVRSNRFAGIVACAFKIEGGNDPQYGGPTSYGNLISNMQIQGNEIKSGGDGILINAGRRFYWNPASGSSSHTINNVYLADNSFSTAGIAVQVIGGMCYQDGTVGADSNVVENISLVRNTIVTTAEAGIILASGRSYTGPTQGNQLRRIVIADTTVSGAAKEMEVIGGEGAGARNNSTEFMALRNGIRLSDGACNVVGNSGPAINNDCLAQQSLVSIGSIDRSGDGLSVRGVCQYGMALGIKSADTLAPGSWAEPGSPMATEDGRFHLLLPWLNAGQGFFKISCSFP